MNAAIEPWKLLPPNSTRLEIDLLKTPIVSEDAITFIGKLGDIKYNDTPEQFVPWLIVEHGLLWARDFLGSDAEVLEKGQIINKLKGTPAAVTAIMEWFGYDSASVREVDRPLVHFAEFQINAGEIIEQLSKIGQIYEALQHVIPLRSRFRRIFYGYDKRVFYLGESKLGEGYLNSSSGIDYDSLGHHDRKTGLVVSFGRTHTDGVPERVLEPEDYYYKENFYRNSGQLERSFPILSEGFEGSFYNPRFSVYEGWGRVSTDKALQPVANWSEFSWEALGWYERIVLDSHFTE
jgi:P2-related tail formation protein